MQLGLVLVLIIVYALLEHQTEQAAAVVQSLSQMNTTVVYFPDEPQNRYVQKDPKVNS